MLKLFECDTKDIMCHHASSIMYTERLSVTVRNQKEPARKSRGSTSKQAIVEASIALMELHGSKKLSMGDIAAEAGISRKTLYRVFEDRASLIEQILRLRLAVIAAKVRKKFSTFTDLEQALVEGSLYCVAAARRDKLISNIVQEETDHRLDQFLLMGNAGIRSDLMEIWAPLMEIGRNNKQLRGGLSNERMLELIIGVHGFLLMRDDYGRKEQRAFLVDFMVPALLLSKH